MAEVKIDKLKSLLLSGCLGTERKHTTTMAFSSARSLKTVLDLARALFYNLHLFSLSLIGDIRHR